MMDKMFYSNCFFEAIKAKLKNWKSVKITYIPARYNECYCPHFLWSDGEADYDFGIERYLRWYERIWFKGQIRKRKLGWNKRWKSYRIARRDSNTIHATYESFFGEKDGTDEQG